MKKESILAYVTKVKDALVVLSLVCSFLFFILRVLWSYYGEIVNDFIADNIGLSSISQKVDALSLDNQAIRQDISILRKKLDTISPEQIVEYDEIRSEVEALACKKGAWCPYTYRFRRTDFGLGCDKPISEEFYIANHGGVLHPSKQNPDKLKLAQATREWAVIHNEFWVPEEVEPGIGQFYSILEYKGCYPNKPETIKRQISFPLIFKIEG